MGKDPNAEEEVKLKSWRLVSVFTLACLVASSLVSSLAEEPRITIRSLAGGGGEASFVITSSRGTVILVDPFQVDGAVEPDLIVVTHTHDDHYDRAFIERCDCRKSIAAVESFTLADVEVVSIPASHYDDDVDIPEPSNVIYLFALDGIRLACMGDIGQKALNAEQLKALGRTDIVILPCASLSKNGLSIEKSSGIIRQLNPRIVIPTHVTAGGQILTALKAGLSYERIAQGELTVSAGELWQSSPRLVYLRDYNTSPE